MIDNNNDNNNNNNNNNNVNYNNTFYMHFFKVINRFEVLLNLVHGCLATSDLFHTFIQSIKSYTFYCHVLESTDV